MSLFEDVMSLAVQMPTSERERLARALGLSVHTKGPGKLLPLNQFVSPADPAAAATWRRAETGHAVVDTAVAPIAEIAAGPQAIASMWAAHAAERDDDSANASLPLASSLAPHTPVLVHTSVCRDLALGLPAAIDFWKALHLEARLATATYLSLLGAAETAEQVHRLQRFVQPFAVLSLGPMASSRAVELILGNGLSDGLDALDSLVAATALAHEIPLLTSLATPFANVAGLQLVRPY